MITIHTGKEYCMKMTIVLIGTLIFIIGCGSDNSDSSLLEPIDLIPDDGEISGWQWDGSPAQATDQSSLYDLINGGAVEFVERGFVSGVLERYSGTIAGSSTTTEVFIADMGDPSNAGDIFEKRYERLLFSEEYTNGFEDTNDARIDEATTLDSTILDFWQSRFYVQITVNNRQLDTESVRLTAEQFARNISRSIASEE